MVRMDDSVSRDRHELHRDVRDGASIRIHFELFGKPWAMAVQGALVLTVLWLICLWMYRRKLFLRI
jgi:hypothetical protein